MQNQPQFTLLYDGLCPICRKEVAWLQWKNTAGKLGLQDIHAEDFNPGVYGKTISDLMGEIHGLTSDGKVLKGMPVFRAAYQAVGLGWLLAPTAWPLLKPLFDRLYIWFARHRIKLGSLINAKTCKDDLCKTNR